MRHIKESKQLLAIKLRFLRSKVEHNAWRTR